jgi:hypothetical protein
MEAVATLILFTSDLLAEGFFSYTRLLVLILLRSAMQVSLLSTVARRDQQYLEDSICFEENIAVYPVPLTRERAAQSLIESLASSVAKATDMR